MNNKKTDMSDLGLKYIVWPITHVRIHRTDGKWLVEYRRKPKWYFDQWWWFDDGKYVDYTAAKERANTLVKQGFTLYLRYNKEEYVIKNAE